MYVCDGSDEIVTQVRFPKGRTFYPISVSPFSSKALIFKFYFHSLIQYVSFFIV